MQVCVVWMLDRTIEISCYYIEKTLKQYCMVGPKFDIQTGGWYLELTKFFWTTYKISPFQMNVDTTEANEVPHPAWHKVVETIHRLELDCNTELSTSTPSTPTTDLSEILAHIRATQKSGSSHFRELVVSSSSRQTAIHIKNPLNEIERLTLSILHGIPLLLLQRSTGSCCFL